MYKFNQLGSIVVILVMIFLAMASDEELDLFADCREVSVSQSHTVNVTARDQNGNFIPDLGVTILITHEKFVEEGAECIGYMETAYEHRVDALYGDYGSFNYVTTVFDYDWNLDNTTVEVQVHGPDPESGSFITKKYSISNTYDKRNFTFNFTF